MVKAVALFDECNESLELAARYVGMLLREWPMLEMLHTGQLQVLISKSSSARKHVDEEPTHLKLLTRRLLPSLEKLAKVLFILRCSLCGLSCSTLPQCPLSPRHPAPTDFRGHQLSFGLGECSPLKHGCCFEPDWSDRHPPAGCAFPHKPARRLHKFDVEHASVGANAGVLAELWCG